MLERNLITFLTMAEVQSTVRCAERLHITQPAVTQHLHAVEEEYGSSLFRKEGRRLVLTDKGKELYELTRRLHTMDRQIAFRMRQESEVPIRFGVTRSINEGVMPLIAGDLLDHYPDRPVEMTVNNTRTLLELLEDGIVDFALIEGNFEHGKYECRAWMDAEFLGFCGKKGKYSRMTGLSQAFQAPLLLREPGSGTRDILESVLSARGFELGNFQKISQFESIPVILELVKQDRGITFAYRIAVRKELEREEIEPLPEHVLYLKRQFWFVTLPSSPFAEDFLELFDFFIKTVRKRIPD